MLKDKGMSIAEQNAVLTLGAILDTQTQHTTTHTLGLSENG